MAERPSEQGTRSPQPRPLPDGDAGSASLAGLVILLVEDEALLALDLRDTLEEAGATVVGPIVSVPEAVRAAQEASFDAAILDVDLQGDEVFPAAQIIAGRDIPFLFHTAHGEASHLRSVFADVPTCSKPSDPMKLLGILGTLIRDRGS